MKKTPADKARDIVSLLEDADASMEEFEFILNELFHRRTSGELKAKIEGKLMKMDEAAEEQQEEEAIYADSLAYDNAMENKMDMMREDNAAYRRGA